MTHTISIDDELLIHKKQRDKGHSVLSVFVGPVGISIVSWKRFAERIGRQVVRISSIDRESIIRCWLDSYRGEQSLIDAAIHCMARIKNIDPVELKYSLFDKSPHDRQLFLENIFHSNQRRDIAELCLKALNILDHESEWSIDQIREKWIPSSCYEWRERIRTTHDLMPSWSPAFLFALNSKDYANHDMVMKAGEQIAKLVEIIPSCPIAWALPESEYQRFLDESPESRAKTICQESVIRLRTLNSEEIKKRIDEKTDDNQSSIDRTIETLVQDGVDDALVNTLINTVEKLSQPRMTAEQEDYARSQIERLLFERLESIEETSGIFQLNERLPIPFGPHATMEVDICSSLYRIAIEIDGFYHFNDREAYCRDRRKDFVLQRHGYFVIRFLDDEITLELDVVLSRIRQVLSARKEILP